MQHRVLAAVFPGDATQLDLRDRRARGELVAELGEDGGAELAV